MNRIAVRPLAVVVVVLLLAGLRARTAPQGPGGGPPPGTGLILGRVVDAASSTPVSGVLVSAGAGVAGPQNVPRIVLTDAQGRFVFRQLPQGRYTLSATIGDSGFSPSGFLISGAGHQIGAYLNGGYGQQRPNGPLGAIDLAEGEKVGDAVIRMWKGGAIEGTVVDEVGEPLVGAAVAAVLRDGAGRLLSGPTTRTDDRGQYHIGTLVPGDYVVVVPQTQILMPLATVDAVLAGTDPSITARLANAGATVRTGAGIRTAGVFVATGTPQSPTNILAPASTERRFIYQSTFHPSATVLSRATPIRVRSGETHAAADVQLQPVTAVEVAGRLQDDGGPVAQFGVHLLPADAGDGTAVLEVAVTSTDARGQFVFPLVPPGSYRILAVRTGAVPNPAGRGAPPTPRTMSEQVGAWAEQLVAVGDQNVGNLALTLKAGVQNQRPRRVSGHARSTGCRSAASVRRRRPIHSAAVPRERWAAHADRTDWCLWGVRDSGRHPRALFNRRHADVRRSDDAGMVASLHDRGRAGHHRSRDRHWRRRPERGRRDVDRSARVPDRNRARRQGRAGCGRVGVCVPDRSRAVARRTRAGPLDLEWISGRGCTTRFACPRRARTRSRISFPASTSSWRHQTPLPASGRTSGC